MENEESWVDLINLTKDFSFGTLWWVRDRVWKAVKPDFHLKNPRKKHPACCLGRKKIESIFQTIPMLLGSHSFQDGFAVDGVSFDANKNKHGYFAFRPYNIAAFYVIGRDPDMVMNESKPKLTDKEQRQLKSYLKNRGVDFYETI